MKVRVGIFIVVASVFALAPAWAKVARPEHATRVRVASMDSSRGGGAIAANPEASRKADRNEAALSFVVDSGVSTGGWGYGPGEAPWLALNRFVVGAGDFPFALTEVSCFQTSSGGEVGDPIRVAVFLDADGDGNPSNATILSVQSFTVGVLDDWDIYTIAPVLVNGPAGDLYIGVIYDKPATGSYFPCGFDDNGTGAEFYGYEVAWGACDQSGGVPPSPVPNPLTWPPDCNTHMSDFPAGGGFMIRGAGVTPPPPVMTLGTVSFDDACPYGMADDDGYADPGETITFYAQIKNVGFVDATNVVATLTSPYPFAITSGTASLGTIGIGGSATAVFTFNVPLSATCGVLPDLDITVTADQEPALWPLVSPFRVGEYYEGATVNIFTEKFETWPLPGWTIVSNGPTWFQGSTGYWSNWVGTGDFAEIDTYMVDFVSGSSTLTSPAFDIDGAFGTANLQYKTQFYDYYGTQDSYLDITTDGGGTWTHLQTFHDVGFGGVFGPFDISLNSYIGMTGLQLRFVANSPDYYTIWEIDDFTINAKYPDTCYSEACVPPFAINILTPIDGRDLYGITEVCAQVTDPALVWFVNWYIDGTPIAGCQDLTTLPYCCVFDPQLYGIGAHTLQAEAVLLSEDRIWSAPVTFYTVGTVMAFPDAFPPSGLVPLTVLFTSNAVWGSGQYVFDWWVPGPSGTGGMTYSTTEPTQEITFTTAGDYLVTLFVTDTMGTAADDDDIVRILPAIKITAAQLAIPITPNANRHASMVGAM